MIKVSSGMQGLDDILDGGFPRGRVVLLLGGPGTGKTLFSLQFLTMAAERGERGVYLTLEEPLRLVRENVQCYGWGIDSKEKEGRLKLLDFSNIPYMDELQGRRNNRDPDVVELLLEKISQVVDENGVENIVIDPITSVTVQENRVGKKRGIIASLFKELRDIGCTSLLTSETTSSRDFTMEEFLADGVIRLDKCIHKFNLINVIRVEKMRGVFYNDQPKRYTINENGFNVLSTEPINF